MNFARLADAVLEYGDFRSHLRDHIYGRSAEYFRAAQDQWQNVAVRADVERRQSNLRESLLEGLGGLPPSDAPLNPRITGRLAGNGYSIEKIIFEARENHFVTGHVYLPENLQRPAPAVLFLSGHGRPGIRMPDYQAACQYFAGEGFLVFAIDPIGQGERLSYFHHGAGVPEVFDGTAEHEYAGIQCRLIGDGIARYFAHDAIRALDYLVARPEVDAREIGVTGNSGGGLQTCLLMMLDPRVAAAAPGTFLMSRATYQRTGQAQDAEQLWPGLTRAGFDHRDVLAAMAPKPVCVLAVTSDFFPIEGTRRTVEEARKAWEIFDRAGDLELVEDDAIHSYTPKLVRAASAFFSRHLLQRSSRNHPWTPQIFPESELHCTRSGQISCEISSAQFVFDANIRRLRGPMMPPSSISGGDLEWLRARVVLERRVCDLNLRRVFERISHGLHVTGAFWWTQADCANVGLLFRSSQCGGSALPVTIGIWDQGTDAICAHERWIRKECGAGRAVLVVNVSGEGAIAPHRINPHDPNDHYGTLHKLADDLEWLGDSLAALRTYDVLRAVQVIGEWPGLDARGLAIRGAGRHGIYGRLAALLCQENARFSSSDDFTYSEIVENRFFQNYDIKALVFPGILSRFIGL